MNNNANITIWNKYVDARAEVWQRVEIERVHFESAKIANTIRTGGQISADKINVYIPWARCENYLPPRQWQALADKSGYWTLQEGDVIARGIIEQELSSSFTTSQLKAAYDDVFVITSVDNMSIGSKSMWHYQVGAK